MHTNKVLIAAIFAMVLVSAMMVSARHLDASPSEDLVDASPSEDLVDASPSEDLVEAASDLTHALESIIESLRSGRSTGRRRRMVQFDVGRHHHSPRYYSTSTRRRQRDYRNQRGGGGRISDISDH